MKNKQAFTKLFSFKTLLGFSLLGMVSIFFCYPFFGNTPNRIFCYVYFLFILLFFFLFLKFKKNSSQELKKMLFFLFLPFLLLQLLDILFLPNILKSTGYSILDSFLITKHFTVFAFHLEMLIFLFLLIILKKYSFSFFDTLQQEEIPEKIIKTFPRIFNFIIPLYTFTSILSKPIWQVFYDQSEVGVLVFSLLSILQIASFLFLFSHYFLIRTKSYKPFTISVLTCFLIQILFQGAFAYAFYNVGISSVFGLVLSQFLGYFVSSLLAFFFLLKKYHLDYELPIKYFFDILICVVLTSIIILFLRTFLVFPTSTRFTSLIETVFYFVLSFTIYIYLSKQFGFTKLIFEK